MSRLMSVFRGSNRLRVVWRASMPDHTVAIAWSPDCRQVAAAAVSGPARVLDAATGSVVADLAGHGFGTTDIAWLGTDTVATAGQDGTVRLWNASTGAERRSLPAGAEWVERLAVHPQGHLIAAAAGRAVRIWSAAGDLLRECPGHLSTVVDLAWRPGTEELAAAGYGGIALWTPARAERVRSFDWKGSILVAAWSPDGKSLATGNQDSTVHFWDYDTGSELQMWGYPTKVRALAWDRTSRYLATGGGSQATVWDCSGKGPEGTKPLAMEVSADDAVVETLTFQHAGPALAAGGTDGMVVVWEPGRNRRPTAAAKLDAAVTRVAWSADDRRLLAGTAAGEVVVFQL